MWFAEGLPSSVDTSPCRVFNHTECRVLTRHSRQRSVVGEVCGLSPLERCHGSTESVCLVSVDAPAACSVSSTRPRPASREASNAQSLDGGDHPARASKRQVLCTPLSPCRWGPWPRPSVKPHPALLTRDRELGHVTELHRDYSCM